MKRLFEQRYLVKKNLVTLIGIGLFMYFSYHLVQGERSYIRFISLNETISRMETQTEDLRKQREELETKVAMMRPGSVDRDLLEERARIVIGFRREGEKDLLTIQK